MSDEQTKVLRPTRIKDITGNRYGMLVVLGISPDRSESGKVLFDCLCDCGQAKAIMGSNLKRGLSLSCGCQVLIAARKPNLKNRTHGYANTWVHAVWFNMIDRCYNPDVNSFPRYGGRGIRVCDRWKNSIADFHADMGDRPTPDHSIDRINNDGDYSPENCRWATAKDQANNRRSSHILEFQGESMTIAQWSERTGLSQYVIGNRIRAGWTPREALTSPKGTPWARSRMSRAAE
jgi:hypothetical protein